MTEITITLATRPTCNIKKSTLSCNLAYVPRHGRYRFHKIHQMTKKTVSEICEDLRIGLQREFVTGISLKFVKVHEYLEFKINSNLSKSSRGLPACNKCLSTMSCRHRYWSEWSLNLDLSQYDISVTRLLLQ